MQEHPIPQDITGYRFHIIGSMTLKQFGEVFLGVVIAVLFYSTNLTGVIKWPLILMSVGIGAAAAFIPIEERPLDHWIATFIKVMYKPTKFFWKKNEKIPEAFLYESLSSTVIQEPELDLTPAKRRRIKEYLNSIPEQSYFSTDFSQDEISRMQNILASFQTVEVKIPTNEIKKVKITKKKPSLDIRIRSMRKPQIKDEDSEVVVFSTNSDPTTNLVQKNETNANERVLIKKTALSVDQVARNINIPKEEMIKLRTQEDEEGEILKTVKTSNSKQTFIKNQTPQTSSVTDAKNVNFNKNLPFPIKPTEPNKLVGMILSQNGDLLTNSIVEVQTLNGHIERAVKTNALGQFFITTPLKVGEYNIVVEKDNYVFKPLHIKINNTIIQPIEIRSEN